MAEESVRRSQIARIIANTLRAEFEVFRSPLPAEYHFVEGQLDYYASEECASLRTALAQEQERARLLEEENGLLKRYLRRFMAAWEAAWQGCAEGWRVPAEEYDAAAALAARAGFKAQSG